MASSISPLNGAQRIGAIQRLAAASGPSKPAANRAPADSITISDAARELVTARRRVAEAPELRAQRVAALKLAVGNGTYQVDSLRLAEKLVRVFAQ
jgi:negative regulator of flagellin synthesis FlgM